MNMEYSADMYRPRAYSAVNVPQAFHGLQQHEQQGQQQYQYWNHHHLMALYQQHQRAALMLGQGGLHGSKQTEPKPRLAKDEVELLEREFAKNPKPNSSTKRELAEQMGVEVPRINNWFQNRRAKEKQMKKTAEFEAQQARQRGISEPNSSDDQDQATNGDVYRSSRHQQTCLSAAEFGSNDDSDEAESDRHPSVFEESDAGASAMTYSHHATGSPASSDSDGFIHIDYDNSSALHAAQMLPELAHIATEPDAFTQEQRQSDFQTHMPFNMEIQTPNATQGLMPSFDITPAHTGNTDAFSERNYFDMPSVAQFPSQLITEGLATNSESPIQHQSPESYIKPENLSPCSMPAALPVAVDMRFKSPPPPADIASRRNMRRPAPLGLSAIRGGTGPKTGIDAPRRSETASPMRRISSATGGLPGRVQKSFSGPRSPFLMDRTKEAIFQSIQNSHAQPVVPQNAAMSPVSPADANGQELHGNTAIKTDEDQGFAYGSMGSFPVFKTDSNIKTPPDTPALATNFPEHFFASSAEQAWNFVPNDEPLPTPSLCSHGGSELEFSMAPQMPGYVASQPVTPSFPPSIGPTYNNGFFGGGNLANAEYTFPDSYPESSARSSPVGPPKSRQQFQFAQNITPQDFSVEK